MRLSLAALLVALALLSPASAARAESGYERDGTVISGSLGAGASGVQGTVDMPLRGFSADLGVTNKISAGGFFGVASSSYDHGVETLTLGYTIIAVRDSYHLGDLFDIDKLDLYTGLSLGYNHVTLKSRSGDAVTGAGFGNSVVFGAHAGGRYFITPAIAGFAEVGYGLGNLTAGASVRFW